MYQLEHLTVTTVGFGSRSCNRRNQRPIWKPLAYRHSAFTNRPRPPKFPSSNDSSPRDLPRLSWNGDGNPQQLRTRRNLRPHPLGRSPEGSTFSGATAAKCGYSVQARGHEEATPRGFRGINSEKIIKSETFESSLLLFRYTATFTDPAKGLVTPPVPHTKSN